jgi:hypothetical protein
MPIQLPERLHFDPYRESGIVITRTPDRILMELPRDYLGSLPVFIVGGAFTCVGVLLSLYGLGRLQWALAGFGVVFGAVGATPLLLGFYLASQRATLELTPEQLAITPLGWGQAAKRITLPWDEITDIRIGFVPPNNDESPSGLVFSLGGKAAHLALSGRPIGELERLRDLLKSLLNPAE